MSQNKETLQSLISPKFTTELLLNIIKKHFNIESVEIRKIVVGEGGKKGDSYLSTITRFAVEAIGKEIKHDGGEPQEKTVFLPIIAKGLPENLARRKTFRSLDFFKNEVAFYNVVWPALQQFQNSKNLKEKFEEIPLCFSSVADGTHDYIALDDLSYKGFICAPRSRGLDLVHTKLILKLFARFHALGLAFKDQHPEKFEMMANSLQETYFDEKFRKWYSPFQTNTLLPVVRDAVEKQLPSSYVKKFDELCKTDFFGTQIRLGKHRGPLAVITHGDAWVPNFLVKYDADGKAPLNAMMIDFQLVRYASLALDITLFLCSCTEQDLRVNHWNTLIEYYHSVFVNTLKQLGSSENLLTLDTLKAEIKANGVFGVGMAMETVTMALLDDDETADLDMIKEEEAALESVWIVHPFKSQEKRQRMADMIKFAIDNEFF